MKILLLGFSRKNHSYEIKRLIKELTKRGHEVSYVYWRGLVFSFSKQGVTIKKVKGKDLKYYDYIIPRAPVSIGSKNESRRVYISQLYRHYLLIVDYINQHNKHILNEKTTKTMLFYDKLFQHYLLAKNGLPIISSLLYTGKQLHDSVYKKFPAPYIAKSIEGSRGKQIFLINDKKEIAPLIHEFGLGRILVQRYIPTDHDYRIIVIGNKIIGGMKRIAAKGEFRSNFSLGGKTEKIEVPTEMKKLAIRATRVFNAEFAGVDIMEHKGRYYILEVNIFSGFEGFEAATEINVAQQLIVYIEKNYLWSIYIPTTQKDRLKIFEDLHSIEKQNLEGAMSRLKFRKELRQKDLIVIKKENKPIAYLTHYKEGKTRYVSRLLVLPEYMGQRIGRRMLRELIIIAKNKKDKKIQAVVHSSNKRRQKSFKRAGFKKKKVSEKKDGFVFEYKITRKGRLKGAGLTSGEEKK